MNRHDADFREIFLRPIRKCALYHPAFGQENSDGLSFLQFQQLYGSDPFYSWIGLDNPLVYAAHKSAGGLTSVYRQIGVGSENLFREILRKSLSLTDDKMQWSYEYSKPNGSLGIHRLDAKILVDDLEGELKNIFAAWLQKSVTHKVNASNTEFNAKGIVFEVRQGYKSADSKRQNADLRFGMRAYQSQLLPAFAIMSTQVSEAVLRRYETDGILVLTGVISDDPCVSTFAFFQQVVGYDLVSFFERNQKVLKDEVTAIIKSLLSI